MKQNTFNVYIKDRKVTSFLEHAQSFMDWLSDTNLLPPTLINFNHVFSEDEFKFLGKEEGKDFLNKNSYFYQDTEDVGLKSILYKRYKHLLSKERIEEMEHFFWWGFTGTIYSRYNSYLGEKKESSIIEIKHKFDAYLENRISDKIKKSLFLKGFEYFLKKVPESNKVNSCEFGYVWVENIGFEQKDMGVVLFNKTFLSSEILFFQIIDKNLS